MNGDVMHEDPLVEAAVRAYLDKRGVSLDTLANSLGLDRDVLKKQLVGVLEERIPEGEVSEKEPKQATPSGQESAPQANNDVRLKRKLSDKQKAAVSVLYDADEPLSFNEVYRRLRERGEIEPVDEKRESARGSSITRGLRNRNIAETVGSKPNTRVKLTGRGKKIAEKVLGPRDEKQGRLL